MGSYGEDLKDSFSAGMAGAANAAVATREATFGTIEAGKNLGPTALVVGGLALAATQEAGKVNVDAAIGYNDFSIPALMGMAAAAATRRLPERGWARKIVSTGVTATGSGLGVLLGGDPITGGISAYAGYKMQGAVSNKKRC